MGSSASHVSRDKDDLLLAAEEGRPKNKRETEKEKAWRERREETARRRRERTLEKYRRKAESCIKNDNLGGLIKRMDFLLYEKKIAEKMRRNKEKQRKLHDDKLARLKVFVKIIRWVTHENGKRYEHEEEKEVELCPSDKFWLFFMWCYSKFLEGIVPIPGTRCRMGVMGIPVASNVINVVQNICSPLIMVGIPKWIHCPPSVMYPVWRGWFKSTLMAYIPLYGTYRYVQRAPVTQATRRLSVYLILRRLMEDSVPLDVNGDECKEGPSVVYRQSQHLTEYIGMEMIYSNDLHKDINGTWSTCCSCCW